MNGNNMPNLISYELTTTSKKADCHELDGDDSLDPDIIFSTPVKHNAVKTLERE
jgi:hypothetical protein